MNIGCSVVGSQKYTITTCKARTTTVLRPHNVDDGRHTLWWCIAFPSESTTRVRLRSRKVSKAP